MGMAPDRGAVLALIGEFALSACEDLRLGLDERDDDLEKEPRIALAMALGGQVFVLELLAPSGASSAGDF